MAAGEVVSEEDGYADIQFGDGSMAYSVPTELFTVVQIESERPLL